MTPLDFFLSHRVAVFPVRPGTKAPAVPQGSNWADWDDFLRPRPERPYGVVLGSLLVIDGDSATTTAWIRAHCPHTPFRVQSGPHHDDTPGRGVHFYYRAPETPTPAFIHREGHVIEARRRGQYVLGPGSPHPSGCSYRPTDWSWRWDDLPIFPADFQFDDGTRRTTPPGMPYEVPDEVAQGERTAEMFRLIRHMKANGASVEATRFAVEQFNQNCCKPPKPLSESWFRRAWNHYDQPAFGRSFLEPLPTVAAPQSFDFTPEFDHAD